MQILGELWRLVSDSAVLTSAGSSFHHCGAKTVKSWDFDNRPYLTRPQLPVPHHWVLTAPPPTPSTTQPPGGVGLPPCCPPRWHPIMA